MEVDTQERDSQPAVGVEAEDTADTVAGMKVEDTAGAAAALMVMHVENREGGSPREGEQRLYTQLDPHWQQNHHSRIFQPNE